ncbi:MAG: Hsp20/alpha crystallin family protein [Lachnospiraceae bacterium]|nr:Hsp20/alpha crystallin family protein [Agathobacter sp.]MDD6290559.1 Hsp20/alpha crystallin family protein [Lachnospiraceae bacterium]
MFDLFDTFFTDPWFDNRDRGAEKKAENPAKNLMQADVKEFEDGYELIMDLPGFDKNDIQAALQNGYLTISATRNVTKDDQNETNGKYIRRERFAGSCQRSFYVGDYLRQEDIKASFRDGILTLNIPKENKRQIEESKYIAIE